MVLDHDILGKSQAQKPHAREATSQNPQLEAIGGREPTPAGPANRPAPRPTSNVAVSFSCEALSTCTVMELFLSYRLGMPLMIINLGGEMMYILEQRLIAQNIPQEKAEKVIADIVRTMYNPKFLQELFKPQVFIFCDLEAFFLSC